MPQFVIDAEALVYAVFQIGQLHSSTLARVEFLLGYAMKSLCSRPQQCINPVSSHLRQSAEMPCLIASTVALS